jgi:hypothetical protein
MKKLSFALIAVLMTTMIATSSRAEIKHVISVSPLYILSGIYAIEYTGAVSERIALAIGGGYGSFDWGIATSEVMTLQAGVRFHPIEEMKAPGGFWVGPSVHYTEVNGSTDIVISNFDVSNLALLANVGYNWLMGNENSAFSINPRGYVGVNVMQADVTGESMGASMIIAGFDVTIGFAF